jgi:putative flippase GtrA
MDTNYTNTIQIKLNSLLQKHPLILQIIKFGLIGTFNFIIDLFIYLILTRKLAFYYILAHVFAFLVANSVSFVLNKNFAFQDRDKNKILIKYFKFLGLTIISLIISATILFICVNFLKMFDIYGKILGTIIAACWNFISYKKLVFKRKDTSNML